MAITDAINKILEMKQRSAEVRSGQLESLARLKVSVDEAQKDRFLQIARDNLDREQSIVKSMLDLGVKMEGRVNVADILKDRGSKRAMGIQINKDKASIDDFEMYALDAQDRVQGAIEGLGEALTQTEDYWRGFQGMSEQYDAIRESLSRGDILQKATADPGELGRFFGEGDVSDTYMRGALDAARGLGKERFDQLLAMENLNLNKAELAARQSAAKAKAGLDLQEDYFNDINEDYRLTQEAFENISKQLELDPKFNIPKILKTDDNFDTIRDNLDIVAAEYLTKHGDSWQMDDTLEGLFNRYKDAREEGNMDTRIGIARDIGAYATQNKDNFMKAFDYSQMNPFSKKDPEKSAAVARLLQGRGILNRADEWMLVNNPDYAKMVQRGGEVFRGDVDENNTSGGGPRVADQDSEGVLTKLSRQAKTIKEAQIARRAAEAERKKNMTLADRILDPIVPPEEAKKVKEFLGIDDSEDLRLNKLPIKERRTEQAKSNLKKLKTELEGVKSKKSNEKGLVARGRELNRRKKEDQLRELIQAAEKRLKRLENAR